MNVLPRVQQLEFISSSAWLMRAGRTGILCNLVGEGFYEEISKSAPGLMKDNGLERLIVEVQEWHLRLLRAKLKGFDIKEVGKFSDCGLDFIECELRLL